MSQTIKEKKKEESVRSLDFLMIGIGTAMYAFGLVYFNIANHLADGGVTGITLILRSLWHIDPAYSTLIINLPLIWIGYRYLGRRSLIYTVYGTAMLAAWLWIWQRIPIQIDLHNDLLLAALGAGLIGGLGSGVVYRYGGTTGGTDIIARLLERFRGIPMGRTLLAVDVLVLLLSLVYIDIFHMAYTLIYSYIFAHLVDVIQDGAYSAKGIYIVSKNYQEITNAIMDELERGVSLIEAEGGYSHAERKMIYVVIAPNELHTLRLIIARYDEQAFVTINDVHQAIGEGFSYQVPQRRLFKHKNS
ncbi:YitT family protein [Levilactobacillus bambusae]|uniref:DUF2179 domain-containing protein n=1 Tax=Levilactobacillus bambusae TaxID=2024736 RepID=A0A2V1N0P3_9LACO|nr:YitT family protein [Levilactobacillus bambusae]PWG00807.1 hypothetical protein DCM90_01115 [Levilactobacillus bambusae]